MGWEAGSDRMTASNVGDLATGPEIALWQGEVVVGVHFLHDLGLEVLVDMGIALVNVIDSLMIVMMEDVLETGNALTAEITNMATVITIIVTGTGLAEIGLQMTRMVVQTVTHKIVMGKIEPMTGMAVQEVMIGTEVECQHEIKEGVLGAADVVVLMTVQAGVVVRLRLTATDCFLLCQPDVEIEMLQ